MVPPAADEVARFTAEINSLLERLNGRRRLNAGSRPTRRTNYGHRCRCCARDSRRRSRPIARPRKIARRSARAREALSLCRIADELLMLSRLNGEVMVDRQRLNLRALLSEIAATVGPLAQSREIKLSVTRPRTFSSTATSGHLRRLVVNLLDNALKFTPAGGSIHVGLKSDANRAIIRVADTGEGTIRRSGAYF